MEYKGGGKGQSNAQLDARTNKTNLKSCFLVLLTTMKMK